MKAAPRLWSVHTIRVVNIKKYFQLFFHGLTFCWLLYARWLNRLETEATLSYFVMRLSSACMQMKILRHNRLLMNDVTIPQNVVCAAFIITQT